MNSDVQTKFCGQPRRGTLREECRKRIILGMSDEEIFAELRKDPRCNNHSLKGTIRRAHDDLADQEVRRRGPWPVAYTKVTGERVFDVGGGHHVGEHSLEALGFKHK